MRDGLQTRNRSLGEAAQLRQRRQPAGRREGVQRLAGQVVCRAELLGEPLPQHPALGRGPPGAEDRPCGSLIRRVELRRAQAVGRRNQGRGDRVTSGQVGEAGAVDVDREHAGDLPGYDRRIGIGGDGQVEFVVALPDLDPSALLVRAVDGERQAHHAVPVLLGAMAETDESGAHEVEAAPGGEGDRARCGVHDS